MPRFVPLGSGNWPVLSPLWPLAAASVVALAPAPASGQSLRPRAPGTPQPILADAAHPPGPAVLRQDEDWSFLEGSSGRPLPGRLKWLPVGEDVRLSLALDARFQIETFDNEQFGTFPGRDGTFHVRFDPHVAIELDRRARLYLAIESGQVSDRTSPPGPADDDGPDLYQAFAELALGDLVGLSTEDLLVRAGRQELHYGAGRMISVRVSPNLPIDFAGLFVRGRIGNVVAEAFAARQSEDRSGAFNNRIDRQRAVWGLYSSTRLGERHNVDVYYIGFNRDVSPYAFDPDPLAETRHSLGARLWTGTSPAHGLYVDLEVAAQFGRFDRVDGSGGRIRAWKLGLDAAYGFPGVALAPIVKLQVGVNSGDGDPGDDTLRTFRAPNPPGRYYGEGNPLGPGNQIGFRAMVDLQLSPRVSITPEIGAQWRLSLRDGIYNSAQFPLRGNAGDARYILNGVAISGDFTISPEVTLVTRLARYGAGAYLEDNPPAEDIYYFELGTLLRF